MINYKIFENVSEIALVVEINIKIKNIFISKRFLFFLLFLVIFWSVAAARDFSTKINGQKV